MCVSETRLDECCGAARVVALDYCVGALHEGEYAHNEYELDVVDADEEASGLRGEVEGHKVSYMLHVTRYTLHVTHHLQSTKKFKCSSKSLPNDTPLINTHSSREICLTCTLLTKHNTTAVVI